MSEKKKKKQGVIRTGAVGPFVIIVSLVCVFNVFLLDSSIKSVSELVLGKLVGAEVNIDKVETSFKDLSGKLIGLQVTNPNEPSYNLVTINEISFNVLWDALLRGKFVIELANVENILLNKKRSYPGEVYPRDLDKKTGNHKVAQKAFNKIGKEFEGNVFGDIASVLGGGSTGDVTDAVVSNLESKKEFEKLSGEVKLAQDQINADLKKLPGQKELSSYQKRFKKIKWKDLKNILKAPGVLKEASKLNKDINKSLASYKTFSKNTQNKLNNLNERYKKAESLIDKDLKSVSSRMSLPSLDQKSIAKMIFGPEVLSKVSEAKKYSDMAKEYMPPKKDKKPTSTTPARGKGKDYHFGKPNSYPSFWLKTAKINSQNEQGKISGKLLNLTNDQNAINNLTDLVLKADFPVLNIRGVDAKVTLDHRKNVKADIDGSVKEFLVKDKVLSKSEDAFFSIKKSSANSVLKGTITEENISLKVKNFFKNIVYETKAKSKEMDLVLKDVAKKTKVLTLDAKVKGKLDDLKFDVKSNLAKAIENSVRSLVQEKIEGTKKKIRNKINSEVNSAKANVDGQLSKLKKQYNDQMSKINKEFNKIKSQIKKEEKKAKKSVSKSFKGIKL